MRSINSPIVRLFLSACAFVSIAGPAQAASIMAGSTLNFAGQSTCNATTCSFGNTLVTSGTGNFSIFPFGTPANFSTLTYNPFTPQQVYSVTLGGITASFTALTELARSTSTTAGIANILLTDGGIVRLTGFDDTPGVLSLTTNQNGSIMGSFSATNAVSSVPEPASWALLIGGFGLIGAGLRRRRAGAIAVG